MTHPSLVYTHANGTRETVCPHSICVPNSDWLEEKEMGFFLRALSVKVLQPQQNVRILTATFVRFVKRTFT